MKLEQARAIVDAVTAEARAPVSVFVASAHGELVAAVTMDGAAPDTRLNAAAQGVHRSPQRCLLDPGARREGRLERRRARQLRSLLHLLPGWRRGLRGRAACGIGRRQRPRRSRRRCTRAASARRGGSGASDEARAPLHGEDQRGLASRRSGRGGDRRGGEPRRRPRPGVCERARDRARARELRGPAGRRGDRRRLHLAPESASITSGR